MKNVVEHKLCTGCTTCFNICPNKAIEMIEDEEGFSFPTINEEKCVNCGLCARNCPVKNTSKHEAKNVCYAAYNKNLEVRKKSSSGGVFNVLARYVLNSNGFVVGASFDDELHLIHKVISNEEELPLLMGSKYLQSELKNTFRYLQTILEKNLVLFVGTPCQIAGLRAFLQRDYENLICVDLICHGVPSPKMFSRYLEELERLNNSKVVKYNFRDKVTGWENYSNTAEFNFGKFTQLQRNNAYMKLFLSDAALRESCYNCKFKLGNKYSDITLGDFWGIANVYPEMYNTYGVSSIILNTEKGERIFEKVRSEFECKQCKLEEIVMFNPCLKESPIRNVKRDSFFIDIDKLSFNELTRKYEKRTSLLKKVCGKMKSVIKSMKDKNKL